MAISPQAMSVSNIGRKKRGMLRSDVIKAAYGQATQDVLARKERERLQRSYDLQKQSADQSYELGKQGLDLTKQQMENQERAGQIGLGTTFLGMAPTISKFGGRTLADRMPNLFQGEIMAGSGEAARSALGFLGGLDPARVGMGGLVGAGVGNIIGGKKKAIRGLVGAGTGALASWLTEGSLADTLSSGFLGGLGAFL